MKKKFDMKSMLAGLIVGICLFGCATAAGTMVTGNVYFSPFPIVLNGKNYTSGSAILNYMGTTYVSLKELAELTGSKVTFSNNTIYVNNSSSGNSINNLPTTSFTEMTLKKNDKETVFVNLSKYNAQSATVSCSGSSVKVSQTFFSYNGTFSVEAVENGKATITVRYNNGSAEYVYVTVEGKGDDELEIEVGDYDYIDIDLDEYDADKATLSITKGSSYISLAKTSVTKNTEVKVTGKKEGSATIKIKYDSGDTEYIYVEVVDDDDDDDELEIEVGDYEYIDIDLDEYDADKATLSITKGSSYISLSKTSVTKNTEVKVTGKKEGSATIKIKYDSGDTEYVYVEVVDEKDDDDDDELEIEVGDYEYIDIDLDEYDADKATLSITKGSSYISLSKTSVTKNTEVKVTGKKEGSATIKIKYDSGDTEYVYVEVVDEKDDDDKYDYDDFDYAKEIDVDVDDYETYYINLEKYGATKANLSVINGKSYISIGKAEVTTSEDVKIYGNEEGESIIKIEFNNGKTIYLWIEVSE